MTKHEALGAVVAAIRSAGIPFYQKATTRRKSVSGAHVAISHRGGIDVFVNGDAVRLSAVRGALSAGWREVYVNEAGKCITVRSAS